MQSLSQPSRQRSRGLSFPVATLLLIACAVAGNGCAGHRRPTATAWGTIATDSTDSKTEDIPGSDRDQDGVTDDRERALGSNPGSADSDNDGYADGYEDRLAEFGFDLTKPTFDRDKDGLSDDLEKTLGTNPASPDSDGDGWSDFDEELIGTSVTTPA